MLHLNIHCTWSLGVRLESIVALLSLSFWDWKSVIRDLSLSLSSGSRRRISSVYDRLLILSRSDAMPHVYISSCKHVHMQPIHTDKTQYTCRHMHRSKLLCSKQAVCVYMHVAPKHAIANGYTVANIPCILYLYYEYCVNSEGILCSQYTMYTCMFVWKHH